MRILVTGCLGTLGIPLITQLLARGHIVYGCDLRHSIAERRYMRADVADYRQLRRVFNEAKPDICYHMAAEFGRINGEEYYEQMWRSNVIGTRNVIDACADQDCVMVMFSSSEAYGTLADSILLHEDLLDHKVPSFHNEYALSKYTNEKQVELACRYKGLRAVVLRLFNVYGPGEHYTPYRSVVCRFIWKLMHNQPIWVDKTAARSLLYVDDFVNTAVNIAGNQEAIGKKFNIAHPNDMPISQLANIVSEVLGCTQTEIKLTHDNSAVQKKVPDMQNAVNILGHKCLTDVYAGICATVSWMKGLYDINSNDSLQESQVIAPNVTQSAETRPCRSRSSRS